MSQLPDLFCSPFCFYQGLKISLVPSSVSPLTSLDYEILHLIWTMEKMQQQLDMIDERWEL